MNKDEYAKNINAYITDYIKFADAKAASAVTAMLIMSGGLFSLIKIHLQDLNIFPPFARNALLFISFTLFICCLTFILKSLHSSFCVFSPRFNNGTGSLNSFPHIKTFPTHHEYISQMKSLGDDDIYLEYSKHNWELSNICIEKFTCVKQTFNSFKYFLYSSAGFGFWVITVKTITILGNLK